MTALSVDGDDFFFSQDGKIDVENAILTLIGREDVGHLMDDIKRDPAIMDKCEQAAMDGGARILADSSAWEEIFHQVFIKLIDAA